MKLCQIVRRVLFHGTTLLFLLTSAALAQIQGATPAAATSALTFDVASIRQNNTSIDGHHHIYSAANDSHFRSVNVSVKDLLQLAYDLPATQILGGPAWLESITFDIDAKAGPEVDAKMHDLSSDQGRLWKRQMVQTLLVDRFQLKTHEETRQLPVYALVVAKNGSRFKPSEANGTTIDGGRSRIHVQGSDNTLTLLARELALSLGRVVLDNTGITGRYDLTLRWTPDDAPPTTSADAPPDIFTAIQEQLGLKLESTKGPVPVLVVDHIAMPSEN
jgi:uncharacterized protein (TIGR03435 family)